ncbi:MAG: heme exporter protein CcmB, partial [Jannaschia sp.]
MRACSMSRPSPPVQALPARPTRSRRRWNDPRIDPPCLPHRPAPMLALLKRDLRLALRAGGGFGLGLGFFLILATLVPL